MFIDLDRLSEIKDYQLDSGAEFSHKMLLQACILSGCDYHPGIAGIGYKKSLQMVKSHQGNI